MDELRDFVEAFTLNWPGEPKRAVQLKAAIDYAVANTRHIYPELLAFQELDKALIAKPNNGALRTDWTDAFNDLIRASGLPETTPGDGKAGEAATPTADIAEAIVPEKELD